METRNVKLTLKKAEEWYAKGGELREIALQAYKEDELTKSFKKIKDFNKVISILNIDPIVYNDKYMSLYALDPQLAYDYKISLILKALNGEDFTPKNQTFYYPYFYFYSSKDCTKEYILNKQTPEYLCAIIDIDSTPFYVTYSFGGYSATALFGGISAAYTYSVFSYAAAYNGARLACKSQEIVDHFQKYFYVDIINCLIGKYID